MRLLLVRHGETEGNVRGVLDTVVPGPSLTEVGHRQAAELVHRFADEPVVAVYASEALRARQTAAPLAAARGLEVLVVEGVTEVSAGDLEGRSDPAAIGWFTRTFKSWAAGELGNVMPGGETGGQVRARVLGAVQRLRAAHEEAHPEGVVVLVGHGGAMRLGGEWMADNVDAETAGHGLIPNTGVIDMSAVPGGWHCLTWAGFVPGQPRSGVVAHDSSR